MHALRLTARRLAALVVAAASVLAVQTAAPPAAHAGTIFFTAEAVGPGRLDQVEPLWGLLCNPYSGHDPNHVESCPEHEVGAVFQAWVWVRATPDASSGFTEVEWENCDELRTRDGLRECAVHSPEFASAHKRPRAHFRDVTAPTLTPISVSLHDHYERYAFFQFEADDTSAVKAYCTLDQEPEKDCGSRTTFRPVLSEGWHTLRVVARDASGNESAPQTTSIKVVETEITHGPTNTASSTATFDVSTASGTAFECSLDGAPFAACPMSSPSQVSVQVGRGPHQMRVRAVDGEWVDSVPATWEWTVDPDAPTDPGPPVDPTGPGTPTDPGTPTQPTDPGTPTDPRTPTDPGTPTGPGTPAPDRAAPDTRLTAGPAHGSVLRATRATVRASATEAGSSFRCTLDGRTAGCASGTLELSGLRSGTHEVRVAAVDRSGNVDRSPAVRRFTVPTDLRGGTGWKRVAARGAWGGSVLSSSSTRANVGVRVTRGTTSVVLIGASPRAGAKVVLRAGRKHLGTVTVPRAGTPRLMRAVRVPASFQGTLTVAVSGRHGKGVRLDAVALVR